MRQEKRPVHLRRIKRNVRTKFALKDINPDLPTNWDDYNFVVLEYKISTAQRFQLGFTTDWGYNELRVMSYVPNAWNRLAIPLKYYTELPDPAHDLAATFNHARYTGWVNLGGKRGPMHGVDSIGVRIRRAIEAHHRNPNVTSPLRIQVTSTWKRHRPSMNSGSQCWWNGREKHILWQI